MNLKARLAPYLLAVPFLFSSCDKKESPTEPAINHPPVIERIIANPSEPFTNQAVSLECRAADEDNDALTYDWRSDGGYFDNIDQRRTTWNAPEKVGEYHITVKVDDNKGKTASRNVSLDVITRFDTLLVSEDTYAMEYYSYANPYISDGLFLRKEIGSSAHPYLKFADISSKRIRSAKFRLTLFYGEFSEENFELPANIYKITENWVDEEISWDRRPNYDINPIQRFIVPVVPRYPYTFYIEGQNITNFVKSWINTPSENHGFFMIPVLSDINRLFYSKEGAQEAGNTNYAPALIVEYE